MKISIKNTNIGIPLYEKFRKMSFNNRYVILTASGLTTLSVPLKGGRENKMPVGQVEIDNSQRWQQRHWRTITAAYNRSPFFEFYAPELAALFETRFDLLHEWNLATLKWTFAKLQAEIQVNSLTEPVAGEPVRLLPKHFQDQEWAGDLPRYRQVFMDRHGFIPNVSSIDLIFCMGRGAGGLLRST